MVLHFVLLEMRESHKLKVLLPVPFDADSLPTRANTGRNSRDVTLLDDPNERTLLPEVWELGLGRVIYSHVHRAILLTWADLPAVPILCFPLCCFTSRFQVDISLYIPST